MSHVRHRCLSIALAASLFFTPSTPAFAFTDLSSSLFTERQEPVQPEEIVHDVVPDPNFRAFLNTYYFDRADAPDAAISSADMETLTVIGSKLDGTTYPEYQPEGFHEYEQVDQSPIATSVDEVVDMLYIPPAEGSILIPCGPMCLTYAVTPDLEGLQYATNLEVLAIANPGAYPADLQLPKLTHLHVGVPDDASLPTLNSDNFPALMSLHAYGFGIDFGAEISSIQGLTDLEISDYYANVDLVAQFPLLRRLVLKDAAFAEFPEDFTNLQHLEVLELHETSGMAALPASIGNLTTLRRLVLDGIDAPALPDSVAQLENLEYLQFTSATTGFPDEIGNLTSLKYLDTGNAKITTLPASFTQLASLEQLHMRNAGLTTLPDDIGNLKNLRLLDLWLSPIAELPDSFGELTALETLELSGSTLSELPEAIGNLHNLRNLSLVGNRELEYMPDWIGTLANLEKLTIEDSPLITSVPDSIGNLSSMRVLTLRHMKGLALLPESIGHLSNLEELSVAYSGLTALPDSFVNLTSLRKLDLAGTKVSQLPEEILDFPHLESVRLLGSDIARNDPIRVELRERGLIY